VSSTIEVHVHHDPPAAVASREKMGVLLLILADVAFVASLVFTYLYLRFLNTEGQWLPDGVVAAVPTLTWVINAILVIGLVAFLVGVSRLKSGDARAFPVMSGVALVAVIAAAVMQWIQIQSFAFPQTEAGTFQGTYASSMLILAGANLFHLLLTVFITLGMTIRSVVGRFAAGALSQPKLGKYWWIWVVASSIIVGLMTTFLTQTPYPPSIPMPGN